MATLAQSASALQLPPRPPKAQTGLPYAAPFITPTKPRLTLDVQTSSDLKPMRPLSRTPTELKMMSTVGLVPHKIFGKNDFYPKNLSAQKPGLPLKPHTQSQAQLSVKDHVEITTVKLRQSANRPENLRDELDYPVAKKGGEYKFKVINKKWITPKEPSKHELKKQKQKNTDYLFGKYSNATAVKWEKPQYEFQRKPKRVMYLDEREKKAAKDKKPDLGHYEPNYNLTESKTPTAALEKTEGKSYLSETEHRSQITPGPGRYKNMNFEVTQKQPPVVRITIPHHKKAMNRGPDMTKKDDVYYPEAGVQEDYSKYPRSRSASVGLKGVQLPNKENIRFTVKAAKAKKWVPGVGSYTPLYKVISTPYLKKRCV